MRVLDVRLISSIVVVAGVALAARTLSASFGPPVSAVSVSTIELDGGTETLTLDGNAFSGNGGTATAMTGSIKNLATTAIHDVTISLKKEGATGGNPSFGGATVGKDSNPSPTSTATGTSATVALSGSGLAGTGTSGFTCTGVSSSQCSEVKLSITPSILISIGGGSSVHGDVMEGFVFRPAADGARHGIEDASHDRFAAEVRNVSETSVIEQLEGEVTPPSGVSLTIDQVALQHSSSGAAVPGASVSIHGNTFIITGLSMDDEDEYRLAVVMTGAIPNNLIRLDLSATFD